MSQQSDKETGFRETQKALRENPPKSEGDIAALQFTNEASKTLSSLMSLGLDQSGNGYYDGKAAALQQARNNIKK